MFFGSVCFEHVLHKHFLKHALPDHLLELILGDPVPTQKAYRRRALRGLPSTLRRGLAASWKPWLQAEFDQEDTREDTKWTLERTLEN